MLRANNMSVVPPKFRRDFCTLYNTGKPFRLPISLSLITVEISVGVYLESESAGQTPAAVLRSIQSSKATSMFPSRRFSPAISSLFIRKNMYSSSSTLLSESVNAIIAWVCGMSIMNYLAWAVLWISLSEAVPGDIQSETVADLLTNCTDKYFPSVF